MVDDSDDSGAVVSGESPGGPVGGKIGVTEYGVSNEPASS